MTTWRCDQKQQPKSFMVVGVSHSSAMSKFDLGAISDLDLGSGSDWGRGHAGKHPEAIRARLQDRRPKSNYEHAPHICATLCWRIPTE